MPALSAIDVDVSVKSVADGEDVILDAFEDPGDALLEVASVLGRGVEKIVSDAPETADGSTAEDTGIDV